MGNNHINSTQADDIYYNIENVLKRNGYYIFSHDDARSIPQNDLLIENLKLNLDSQAKDYEKREREFDKEEIITQIQKLIPGKFRDRGRTDILPEDDSRFDIPSIVNYLQWHLHKISEKVIGREEIIEQLLYAILTGEHMLLMSRTGMAKSYLANFIFNIFENVRVFASQASKDQTPDNYFGPYDIEEFKKGVIRHNIKGSVIEANLVLLDEFFDASDVVLRSLLSVLNERKFINGSEQIDVAIHTAIATANYLRLNEVTEAVLDRFVYKAIIPEDTDMYNMLLIDNAYAATKGKAEEPNKKIPFEQIIYLYTIIKNLNKKIQIPFPDSVKFMKNVIINKFVSEVRKIEPDFFISHRKQAKMADFLRASAVLNGRFEVTLQDLRNMYMGLVTLNRYISIKQKDKLFKDVYIDIYEQTMAHFKATNSFPQIDFLLNVKNIFQSLREDPTKREKLLESKGFFQGIKDTLAKLFPFRQEEKDDVTVDVLKKNILDLNPAVEEVRELKQGILKDYKDIY